MPREMSLTLADLVVLSMLAERPMHGYELWAELERRMVQKWAEVSRPQVYYSLRKLTESGLAEAVGDEQQALGPERRVLHPTEKGRAALTSALGRDQWALQRPPPPFLTWMVLSWQARGDDVRRLYAERRRFLEGELRTAREALRAVIEETSPTSDAAMVVKLNVKLFEAELAWLAEVEQRQRPG